MKYAALTLALLGHAAATTVFPCPYTMAESLGVTFNIDVNTENCNGNSIDNKFKEFLKHYAGVMSGSSNLGVFELDNELCEDNGRNLRSSRNLQGNWGYNGGSTCNYCPPWDDDLRRRRLIEGSLELGELEDLMSNSLTALATELFTEDANSCLFGQKIVVTATLKETTECSN